MPKKKRGPMSEAQKAALSEKLKKSWAKRKRALKGAGSPAKKKKVVRRRRRKAAAENGSVTLTVKAGELPAVIERLKIPKGQPIEIQV